MQFLGFNCLVLLGIFLYVIRVVCNCSVVNYVFILAFNFNMTVGFWSSIIGRPRIIVHIQKFVIVSTYDRFDVGDTAVWKFKVLSVEIQHYYMVGVVWVKNFQNEFNKSSSYFCLDRQTRRWIIIDLFTFSIFSSVFLCSVKFKFVVVIGFIYRGLKYTFCVVKCVFIFWDLNKSMFDHFG